MKYMGSKNRIADDILPIILNNRKDDQYFVDLFVGGANLIDKVDGLRIGSDINNYLIALWKGLQNGRKLIYPIEKSLYSMARNEYNNNKLLLFDEFEIGAIGYCGSFNGRFFDGGYSGESKGRNYILEQTKNIQNQIPNILDIEFYCSKYNELKIPDNSIVYCDIPYKDTKQYFFSKNFDYDTFWQWARETSKLHRVFISEYSAPNDFKCVWQKNITSGLKLGKKYNTVEKLFVYNK